MYNFTEDEMNDILKDISTAKDMLELAVLNKDRQYSFDYYLLQRISNAMKKITHKTTDYVVMTRYLTKKITTECMNCHHIYEETNSKELTENKCKKCGKVWSRCLMRVEKNNSKYNEKEVLLNNDR